MVPRDDHKAVATAVLLKIEEVCGVTLEGLTDYQRADSLVNVDLAKALMAELLAKQAGIEAGLSETI